MSLRQYRHYINGQFVENHSGRWIAVINPATEETLSQIPQGSLEDTDLAIVAAEAAQPKWEA